MIFNLNFTTNFNIWTARDLIFFKKNPKNLGF